MEHFIDYIYDNYGGIADYCRALGYSEKHFLKLQGNLLAYECWDAFLLGNKVLITKRARHKYCGGTWECCGGSVLSGECEAKASFRDALEEYAIGYDIII